MIINKRNIRTLVMVIASALIMAFALKNFVSPNKLIPGGFTGIAFIITELLERSLHIKLAPGIFIIMLNVPAAALAFKTISPRFTFFSLLHVFTLSFALSYVPHFDFGGDTLLQAIFGGVIYGFGNILVLESGACAGGTDFLALYYSSKKQESAWRYVLYFNAGLITLAGYLFSWERAMYTILFQFVNTKIIEAKHTQFKRVSLMIISEQEDAICKLLVKLTKHGVTVFHGYGAYTGKDRAILYTVVSTFEVDELVEEIKKIDPAVFINISQSEQIVGKFVTKKIGEA